MSKKNQRGVSILLFVLAMTFVSTLVSSAMLFVASKNIKEVKNEINSSKSYYAAESGIEDTIYRIKSGKNYSLSNSFSLDGSSVNIAVDEGNGSTTISASSNYNNVVKNLSSKIKVSAVKSDFFYGVQVGDGGVEMDQNSQIIGNVYSNGSIYGNNGSTISGDAIVAGSVALNTQAQSIVCNTDNNVGKQNPQIDYAQSFKVSSQSTLSKISLYIKKVGNPNSINVKIAKDKNGKPEDDELAQGVLDKNLVTSNYGWVDITLNKQVSLSANTPYWIVLDAKKNNTNYWIWCSDSNNGYGNGVAMYNKDWKEEHGWNSLTGDLNFKVYTGSGGGTLSGVIVKGNAKANTILNSQICGDAYYQSIDQTSYDFLQAPTSPPCPTPLSNGTGYPNSPDPVPSQMPISDGNFLQWKTDAQNGTVINGNYAVDTDKSLGPALINGDLLLNNNNKTLTVTGTIYVTGNIDISNGSTIKCDASYGTNSCIVIADGWIHVDNNGTFSGSGTQGSYLLLASRAQCTGDPNQSGCTHHNAAIDVHNNAQGVIFYADKGMINLHNGVTVTQATAYKLRIDNTAVVSYEQGLQNAMFSSGPSAGWEILNWQEVK